MTSDARGTTSIEELIASGAIVAHKDGNYGSNCPRVEEFGTEGVAFLTAKSLRDGYVDIAGAPRLGDARADELTFRFVQTDDVLLSHNATTGRVAVVPQHKGRLLVGTSLTYFRLNPQKLLPRYLAVYLAGVDFQNQLVAVMSHSTRNQVPVTAQRKRHVVVPPLAEQKAIASVLGALDDKIELNRRMNATLESMARALFQSWFVDFDPVRAKLDGRQPAGMDAMTAALFPDKFQDSVFGHIPHGWTIGTITDCCDRIHSGGTPRRDEPEYWDHGTIPWLTSGEVRQPMVTATENFISELGLRESSAKWLPANSTVVALYGATAGQVSFLGTTATTNQAICSLIPKPGFEFFNYFAMRGATAEMESKAVGSAQQNISNGIIEETVVILPLSEILSQFNLAAGPLFGSWITNIKQAQTLAILRDTLLPKLLSGDMRI